MSVPLIMCLCVRLHSWRDVLSTVSPFPKAGFDIQKRHPNTSWSSSNEMVWERGNCHLLAVKQEELVYQERLTCDSFIVQSIPGWLDYREHERRAGETEQTQRRENIRG